jgi:hypothetical protein
MPAPVNREAVRVALERFPDGATSSQIRAALELGPEQRLRTYDHVREELRSLERSGFARRSGKKTRPTWYPVIPSSSGS